MCWYTEQSTNIQPVIIVTVCGVNFVPGNLGNRKSYDVKLKVL